MTSEQGGCQRRPAQGFEANASAVGHFPVSLAEADGMPYDEMIRSDAVRL